MSRLLRTLAGIVVGLALVVALPVPCGCGLWPSLPHHPEEHACCAAPTGVRADDHGCCDEDAAAEGVLTPSPGFAAVAPVSALVAPVAPTSPRPRVPERFLAFPHSSPSTVLRL